MHIRVAGYNRHLNMVYLDVFGESYPRERLLLTLECTPTIGRRGFAQIQAKSDKGEILFSVVALPEPEAFAIYSCTDDLIAYQDQRVIRDKNNSELMKIIIGEPKTAPYTESIWGKQLCLLCKRQQQDKH